MSLQSIGRKLLPVLVVMFALAAAKPASATSYYLSPSGSDSNSGATTSLPWLTPNHALNCGDTITAAAGTYSSSNFYEGNWGTVTCAAGNNVAWLICATFDTCKINVSSGTAQGLWVDKSYWGVQGWEITVASSVTYGACFLASPNTTTLASIHHIIFANDICNGASQGGFEATNQGTGASVDYFTVIGSIAYNAVSGNNTCASGINVYQPIASDSVAGTHIYLAGNFAWGNTDGNNCGGGSGTTDGEGINLDTLDFSQGGGTPYTQQAVAENNIMFLNGGEGIEVENNAAGSTHAPVYVTHNTTYGNRRDPNALYCYGNGEIYTDNALNVSDTYNLSYAGYATTCPVAAAYFGFAIYQGNGTDTYDYNYSSGVSGNNTYISTSTGFALGTHNTIGTNPSFLNPTSPGAPACSGKTNVVNCMGTVIANFAASASGASSYGYATPTGTSVVDSLYPHWLCSVTLPAGLVNPGCITTVYNFTTATSQSTVVSALSAGSSGGTQYNWATGNYAYSATLNFPCVGGNEFYGFPATFTPSTAATDAGVVPTTVFASTVGGSNPNAVNVTGNNTYISAGAGCDIRYLAMNGENIKVTSPVSGLHIAYNLFENILGQVGNTSGCTTCYAAVYVTNDAASTQDIGYSTFEWNSLGPNCSDLNGNTTNYNGDCGLFMIQGSNVNVTIQNNNVIGQTEEFVHTLAQGTNGGISTNLLIQNNDCAHVHRICIELQQQVTTNQIVQYNDDRDPYNAWLTSQALSEACCSTGGGAANGNPTVHDNNFIFNLACLGTPCPGYAFEFWGNNVNAYNNLIQVTTNGQYGIAFGGASASVSSGLSATNNIIQGTYSVGYLQCEIGGTRLPNCEYAGTPTYSPNTTSTTVGQQTSTTSTISPAAGTVSFPIIVSLANAGINHSNYYTTDGSTPVPGSGTTKLYTAPFSLLSAATVRVIGMWGSGANTYSYASGWGYGPSSMASATYSASTGTSNPTVEVGNQVIVGNQSIQ